MSGSASNLNIGTAVDTRPIEEGMARAKRAVQDFAGEAARVGNSLGQVTTNAQASSAALASTTQAAAGVAHQFAAIGNEVVSGNFSAVSGAVQAVQSATGGMRAALAVAAGAFGLAASAAGIYADYLYRVRDAKAAVAAVRVTFNPEADPAAVEKLRQQLVAQAGISTEMSAQIAADLLRIQGVGVPAMSFLAAAMKPVAAAMSTEVPAAARDMAQALDQPAQAGQRLLERLGASNDQLNRFHAAMGNNSALEARRVILERINELVRQQGTATETVAARDARRLESMRRLAELQGRLGQPGAQREMLSATEQLAPATDRYAEAVKALTNEQRQAAGPSWMDVHETRLASLELQVKQQARAEGLTRDQARQRELTAQVEFWEKLLAGENLNAKQREDVTRRLLRAKEALEDTQFTPKARAVGGGRAQQDETQELMQEIRLRAQLTDGELQLRKAQLDEEVAAGRITHSQALADFAEFVTQKRALQLEAMDSIITQLGQESSAYRQAAADRIRVEQQAQRQLAQLRGEQLKETARAAQEIARTWSQSFSGVEGAFKSSITGMLMGTTTLQRGALAVGQAVAGGFVELGFKLVSQWAATELAKTAISSAATEARVAREVATGGSGWGALLASWLGMEAGKTAAHAAGVTTRTAITVAGVATEKAAEKAGAMASIGGDAAAAAAGAYKAMVGIPVIGPILAPIAAGVAFAAVMAFGGNIPGFAAGTMNVPQDMTARIHKGEMIVPAGIASALRAGQAAQGFNPGALGGAASVNLSFQISAHDTQTGMAFVQRHARDIARAVKRELALNPTARPAY